MDEGVASQGISAERPTTPTTAPRRFGGGFCLASAEEEEGQRMRIRMAQIVVVGDMVELSLNMPGKTCHLKSIVLMNIFARFLRSSKKQRKNSNIFEEYSGRISRFQRIPLLCHLEVGHRGNRKIGLFSEDVCPRPRTYLRFPRYASKEKKGLRNRIKNIGGEGKPWVGTSYPLFREGWGKYS